ncbi:MAG: adenylate/guanylate cyclase domain-containing protein [Cytophagales bacterium]|nr:adenylate/guanylate cyclase domain-containing protein [Cytophagales bacterium]
MRLFQSPHVRPSNHRFYIITQWAYLIGFCGHIMAYFMFEQMGIIEMVRVNMFFSIPTFLIAFLLNRKGHHNTAFALAFMELWLHQILSTYYGGWDIGAHFWLIYLCGLVFFNPAWKNHVQITLMLFVLASYVLMFYWFKNGIYNLEANLLESNSLSSALICMIIISLLINYYSRAANKAELLLTKEKDKTTQMLDRVESLFGQQVSSEIARELISGAVDFGSKHYEVSILFMDIRDFTVFADSNDPSQVASFQNTVFSEIIDIVRENEGVVLQILGDGIMAVFGAPNVYRDHASKAVNSGLQIVQRTSELGRSGKIPKIRVGIGIHSGQVIAGNVGNASRNFYSLTGKNVIIAARIEQLNKVHQSQLLISSATYEALDAKPEAHDLGLTSLKGIGDEIRIYKLE